jgi:2-oxoglutarate dehydrogenase complex dehydrogenase (E1) component-like enzyme
MSDDNPFKIPEMEPTLRKQIQECNWQVVNVTTPANYFHVLRRQVRTPLCLNLGTCMLNEEIAFKVM